MVYCPKCGISTETINQDSSGRLPCRSCGVVMPAFLEEMANDSVWPSMVSSTKHEIVCPRCGYERYESDSTFPRTKCPSCRTNYQDHLLEALATAELHKEDETTSPPGEPPPIPQTPPTSLRASTDKGIQNTGDGQQPRTSPSQFSKGGKNPFSQLLMLLIALCFNIPGLVTVLVVLTLLGKALLPSPEASKGTSLSAAASERNSDKNCYEIGRQAASIYVENVLKMASENIMASDLMDSTCTKLATESKAPEECKSECRAGFKAAAKAALK